MSSVLPEHKVRGGGGGGVCTDALCTDTAVLVEQFLFCF